jgi:IS5 family transposase
LGTPTNVSDVSQAHALSHGHGKETLGDAADTDVEKRDVQGEPLQ